MIEKGRIVEVENDNAKVIITRHAACGDCGACQIGKDNLNMIIVADNKIGAKKNDQVILELNTENFLFASFIFYGIPLLALLLGISLPYYFLRRAGNTSDSVQLTSSIIGLLSLTITYLLIRRNEKRFKNMKKFKSKIVEIISKD